MPERLKQDHADHIVTIGRLLSHLGLSNSWLWTLNNGPHPGLNGRFPGDMIYTEQGARELIQILDGLIEAKHHG